MKISENTTTHPDIIFAHYFRLYIRIGYISSFIFKLFWFVNFNKSNLIIFFYILQIATE